MQFDYIIIGAGSAGCVLANRLSACGRYSVLLLEAGGSDKKLYIQLPIGYGKTYYDASVNWKYLSAPVEGLGGRESYWPRGKVLGGSSSINAMVYVRGHPGDYAQWEQVAPGWGWDTIEPIFKSIENWSGKPSTFRGKAGPLPVTDVSAEAHPLCDRYLDAATELSLPLADDYNSASMFGASHYQITTQHGLRASASKAYLEPCAQRSNLVVITHAEVQRIVFEKQRIQHIEYLKDGQRVQASARLETILSAGAVNTPKLLQLSGIGPAHVLSKYAIPMVLELPAVGQNLSDHLGVDVVCEATMPTLNQRLRPWYGKAIAGLQLVLKRKGPLTLSLNQAGGFISRHQMIMALGSGETEQIDSAQSEPPAIQLYFSPVSYTRAPPGTRPLINPDKFPGFLLGFNPCKPTSKGHVNISSADPDAAPSIQPNYLDTGHDRLLMLQGMRLMRRFLQTSALGNVVKHEIYPGEDCTGDEQLESFIKANAWTVFHPCCTCRMGKDRYQSVVDSALKVHGIEGLRIADASVFATIPSGNTNAPSIMVGERASQLILQDAPP